MRLPITPQLSTKDGTANKNARLTNALREKDKAVVRPGLSLVLDYAGVGNGLVPWNDRLIGLFDDTVYDLDSAGTGGIGGGGGSGGTGGGGAFALAGASAIPAALAFLPWDTTYTYPLGWRVTYSGTTYTSTVNGNMGITPGSSASWSPYIPSYSFALTAVAQSTIGTPNGVWVGTGLGSITPPDFNSATIQVFETRFSDGNPYFVEFTIDGIHPQTFLTSITIGANTVIAADAYLFLNSGPNTIWAWFNTPPPNMIPAPGVYSVTIT